MRIIFLGTPDFALPSLKALIDSPHELAAVITNPDRKGNKLKLYAPPVKVMAEEAGIKVLQYTCIRKEGAADIRALKPDLMVTAAFGQIISQEILDIPKYGVINVHGSLLPKYRGASPVQQAVLNGDMETGITIMRTEYAVDSGDIILAKSVLIDENETAGELFDKLAILGASALIEAVELIDSDKAIYLPQNHDNATYCRMLTKESGIVSFEKTVKELHNFVRGLNPWPTAYTKLDGKILKLWRIEKYDDTTDYVCGTIIKADSKNGIIVQVKDGTVSLAELQLEGGKRMSGKAFALGHSVALSSVLKYE
ncbi:MAG: methionyl-tRNA formyltransferase [Clostridia bacterium]|nr:methionyl-tRNA formyltransferase [Clostridia bacterium]